MEREPDLELNFQINDPNFDRKFDLVTEGAHTYLKKHLLERITRENRLTIVNYMLVMQTEEVSPSQTYRISTIYKLKQFSEFHKNKSFQSMTRQDVLDFLDRLMPLPVLIHYSVRKYSHTGTFISFLLLILSAASYQQQKGAKLSTCQKRDYVYEY
jgi:hypothetical protein